MPRITGGSRLETALLIAGIVVIALCVLAVILFAAELLFLRPTVKP
jgi:hypothetical protein